MPEGKASRKRATASGTPGPQYSAQDLAPFEVKAAEDDFKRGDPLAVDRATDLCDQYDIPFPAWLIKALAHRARVNLGSAPDLPKKTGRYARNVREGRLEKERQTAAYIAVKVVRRHRKKGKRGNIEIARKALAMEGIRYSEESIRQHYKTIAKKGSPLTPTEIDHLELALDCNVREILKRPFPIDRG